MVEKEKRARRLEVALVGPGADRRYDYLQNGGMARATGTKTMDVTVFASLWKCGQLLYFGHNERVCQYPTWDGQIVKGHVGEDGNSRAGLQQCSLSRLRAGSLQAAR